MSTELRFEGYSDDTFGEYAHTKDDFDNCASGDSIEYLVKAPDGSALLVIGQYAPGNASGWLIGVAPHDPSGEDKPIPDWPMRFVPGDCPYSPALLIEAPDGVTVNCITRQDEE